MELRVVGAHCARSVAFYLPRTCPRFSSACQEGVICPRLLIPEFFSDYFVFGVMPEDMLDQRRVRLEQNSHMRVAHEWLIRPVAQSSHFVLLKGDLLIHFNT